MGLLQGPDRGASHIAPHDHAVGIRGATADRRCSLPPPCRRCCGAALARCYFTSRQACERPCCGCMYTTAGRRDESDAGPADGQGGSCPHCYCMPEDTLETSYAQCHVVCPAPAKELGLCPPACRPAGVHACQPTPFCSATQPRRQDRDVPLDQRVVKRKAFSDPDICKHALAGLCPFGEAPWDASASPDRLRALVHQLLGWSSGEGVSQAVLPAADSARSCFRLVTLLLVL